MKAIDWNAVKADIAAMLTTSQDFWPADYGNYGPFMVRQAWHCSGSYRTYDGHGGCDGGRQRFEPERSWADNTNLDKAKTLLWPIKEKYGLGLSWGDLIILTGNVAIETMGGPVFGFCAGRMDDYDGRASELLGPTTEQADIYPCAVDGDCKRPFGTTTIGLIYVNPEGPMGKPVPELSAPQVRDTFGRMDMNDMETVALIGGGHAFGKTHGACPLGPGPSPKEDPSNPWPGLCGTGRGKDTFTSGFEGPWTATPTAWSNYYYNVLLNNDWTSHVGPGGHYQWQSPTSPGTMMLTSDLSLSKDSSYLSLVRKFASNITALNEQFSRAWYKLTSRDMGPVSRCVGPWVPPAQPFQNPLPPTPTVLPDFEKVKADIRKAISTDNKNILQPDYFNNTPYYGAVFVHLAWQCASTFRHSDYLGGCNGARIRFPPQSLWPTNAATGSILQLLQPIQQSYVNLSWADLIVLAGTVALEDASQTAISFCPGRTDAMDGSGSTLLRPNGNYSASIQDLRIAAALMNLTDREFVALMGRIRSPAQLQRSGFFGSYTNNPTVLSNQYFVTLLGETWKPVMIGKNLEYQAVGKELYMLPMDLAIRWDDTFLAIAQDFASDQSMFVREFLSAWVKMMNADRFDGPTGNLCK
uniref:Plant heme peroxidase family profile domain-containing protein n=1 Tax=Arcella intermedia TaxID=1963864 RepID=A0A6B2KZL8_9EUKA